MAAAALLLLVAAAARAQTVPETIKGPLQLGGTLSAPSNVLVGPDAVLTLQAGATLRFAAGKGWCGERQRPARAWRRQLDLMARSGKIPAVNNTHSTKAKRTEEEDEDEEEDEEQEEEPKHPVGNRASPA